MQLRDDNLCKSVLCKIIADFNYFKDIKVIYGSKIPEKKIPQNNMT